MSGADALRACVLLRLQARRGEWVSLADLVAHLGAAEARVRHVCGQLVDAGFAHRAQHGGGGELYGIGVEGVAP